MNIINNGICSAQWRYGIALQRNASSCCLFFVFSTGICIDALDSKRPLHGVMSGTRIRQKFAKKRSLHGVNEHFSQIFNAIIVPRSSRAKASLSFSQLIVCSFTLQNKPKNPNVNLMIPLAHAHRITTG
ncbi:MAG: hypothetical protein KF888_04355 [Nitrosomonas sp.]|nr:hypothetical protein [Nitrosomonas sp.]